VLAVYPSPILEENDMKKLGFAVAALSVIVLALPSIASAETVIIKRGGDHHRHYDGARAEYRGHRDWHPMRRHHDRVVIVKRRHHGF
jgi:hypothetical protein